jgi:hypothetical protein
MADFSGNLACATIGAAEKILRQSLRPKPQPSFFSIIFWLRLFGSAWMQRPDRCELSAWNAEAAESPLAAPLPIDALRHKRATA